MQSAIFKDARHFQIIFQLTFFCYGIYYLHWSADSWLYATYFITSLLTQFSCEAAITKTGVQLFSNAWWSLFKKGIPSVIISSFGLILLLKTNDFVVAVFSSFIAIASKYFIRINGKHIFNPSALAIVAAVYIDGNAWISPGQWGSGTVILFGAVCLGIIVVTKVQKLDVSLAFLGTYAGLLFIRQVLFLGWPVDFFIQSLSTGSLLLFSFFMITDPKTTPNKSRARIVWSTSVATVVFYLSTFQFINGAPILVLVCLQPLVPLLDYLFKEKHFNWFNEKSVVPFKPINITAAAK